MAESSLGKIGGALLSETILGHLGAADPEVLAGPRAGVDIGVLQVAPGVVMAVTTDPVFVLPSLGWEQAACVGDAGSPTDIERVVLRDGSSVVIRPLAAGDEAAIASWFAGLAAETRYARFFAFLKQLDHRTQSELARVDHFNHEAIAAVASDGSTVGIARYLRIGKPRSAEVAVAVADAWRGRGIASMLLERVATRARAAGIEEFIAICLATNHAVIRLLSRLGATTVGPSDAGVVELRIDLKSTRPRSLLSRAAERRAG